MNAADSPLTELSCEWKFLRTRIVTGNIDKRRVRLMTGIDFHFLPMPSKGGAWEEFLLSIVGFVHRLIAMLRFTVPLRNAGLVCL